MRAVSTSTVTWTSCPQACMTGTSWPARFVTRTVLAYGRPVSSCTGSPSMSPRTSTVGPAPFFSTATTPYPPNLSVTSAPVVRNSTAILAAVFSSISESSGWAWKSR